MRFSLILFLSLYSFNIYSQENSAILCSDGLDNDGDGQVDCLDSECANLPNDGCATCFNDGYSFADTVYFYSNPCPNSTLNNDPNAAIGVSDFSEVPSDEFLTLGEGGTVILGFQDNVLTNSGDDNPDIWIFEVGPAVESSTIALKPTAGTNTGDILIAQGVTDSNSDGFFEFGAISGSTSFLDIDQFINYEYPDGELRFDQIMITDIPNASCTSSQYPGADIDAVCALSSIAVDCAGNLNGTAVLDTCGRCLEPGNPLFNQSCNECLEAPLILTGKNQIGSIDSLWEVSDIFSPSPVEIPVSNLPAPDGPTIAWNSATVIAPCASSWVNPQTFPSPNNQANWITHPNNQQCVTGSTEFSHYYYRTRFSFPCGCIGEAAPLDSSYTITLDLYADNIVLAAYINGELQDAPALPGGNFLIGGQAQVELNGPWQPGENTITFLIRNNPGSQFGNPQGFLAVVSPDADSDGDGVSDNIDLCMCDGHSTVDTSFVYLTSCNPMDTGIVVNTFSTEYGCDSTVLIEKSYLPLDTTFTFGSTCDTTQAGTFCQTLNSEAGCDSLVCQVTTLIPSIDTTFLTATTCDPLQADTSYQTASNEFGCDSIIATVWTFEPLDTVLLPDIVLCEGESFTVGDSSYTATGQYVNVLTASNGCDSVVTLSLNVQEEIRTALQEEICEGEFFIVGTSSYNQSGDYTDTLTATTGCDSIVQLSLEVLPATVTNENAAICEGQVLEWNGLELSAPGDYSAVFTGANGCDSTVVLSLEVLPATVTNENAAICEGQVLEWNGMELSAPGAYSAAFTGADGCDSTVVLSLEVLPATLTNENAAICEGQVLEWNGMELSAPGAYSAAFTGADGCDSTVVLSLEVLPATVTNENAAICEGQVLEWNGMELSAPGDYSAVFNGADGCDSVSVLNLTVVDGIEPAIIDSTICEGENVFGYRKSGTYLDEFSHLSGCDSIRILNLTVESVYIPNAFSPNGDGRNDHFGIFTNDGNSIHLNEVKIFDRWGALVYQYDGNSDSPLEKSWDRLWNGSFNGKPAQNGFYSYYALYTCKETGSVVKKHGGIQLVR